MNRDLFIPKLTPAIARKIKRISSVCLCEVDPVVDTLAEQDRLVTNLPPDLADVAQFIIDHDYRCVISYSHGRGVHDAIAESLPSDARVIFLTDLGIWRNYFPVVEYAPESQEQYQFIPRNFDYRMMANDRDCIMVANNTTRLVTTYLTFLFPKFIMFSENTKTYSLDRNSGVVSSIQHDVSIMSEHLNGKSISPHNAFYNLLSSVNNTLVN